MFLVIVSCPEWHHAMTVYIKLYDNLLWPVTPQNGLQLWGEMYKKGKLRPQAAWRDSTF